MKHTLRTILKGMIIKKKGTITPFQAVSTALAATVGTGNIVGVAVAIQVGDQVLYFGCGYLPLLGWLQSMLKLH